MSLRLRLWVACVAGGAVAGLGSLWVLGTRVRPEAPDPATLLGWLGAVAFGAILAGLLFAVWLDHHVVGHLRGLVRGLRSGRVTELRGLPAASGWGELSELTDVAQELLGRQRRSARAAEDLERVRAQLATLQRSLESWLRSESWDAPADPGGPLTAVSESLTRGFARRAMVDEQNVQAARQVAGELAEAVGDAQESAEQSERGFVEATALLTTVRELQRLSTELQGALESTAPAPAPEGAGVREALGALVESSQQSVDAIGRGMLRVQDVSALVQQLANRATLVAIHAVTASRQGGTNEDLSRELRQLTQDVREATERTAQFAHEIEASVAEAGERMQAARERAAEQLERLPAAPAAAGSAPRPPADAHRLLERVREMVQDAARKGERLSAAGERASRAAERLSRRVAEESAEAQALVVRLSPVGKSAPGAREAGPSRELRLLEGETRHESLPAGYGELDLDAAGDPAVDEPREEERP